MIVISKYCFSRFSTFRSFTTTALLSFPQQKLTIRNVNLNYQKFGKGSIPVLCLPGALGFIESDFGPIINKFNLNEFTFVAWDPPGYGKSRPPDRNFKLGLLKTFQTDAHLAHDLMKNLGFNKFSTIGWSHGGITALLQPIYFPNSIHKMVVFGSSAFYDERDASLFLKFRNVDIWSAKMKAPMIEMYGEKYFRETWAEWVDAGVALLAEGGDICKHEVRNITCPTLILHGLKDPIVPLEHAEFLQENIGNSRLHVMPEGKHNIHLRYPDEFVQVVEEFLLKSLDLHNL